MSQYVYALNTSDYRDSDRILKKDLIWHLAETYRIAGAYVPQTQFDEMWDAPATIERGYVGWPWTLAIRHPFFGSIGVDDEQDIAKVAAVMAYVMRNTDPPEGTPWPEPLAVAEGALQVAL